MASNTMTDEELKEMGASRVGDTVFIDCKIPSFKRSTGHASGIDEVLNICRALEFTKADYGLLLIALSEEV